MNTGWLGEYSNHVFLGGGQHPPDATAVTSVVGRNAMHCYRIRTLFQSGSARGASAHSEVVCGSTGDGEVTGSPLPSVGVSDAWGREGRDATLDFTVGLSRPAREGETISVLYTTTPIMTATELVSPPADEGVTAT